MKISIKDILKLLDGKTIKLVIKNIVPTGLPNRCVYFLPIFRSYGTKKNEYKCCKMPLDMKYR
jgi:hypothetical protein